MAYTVIPAEPGWCVIWNFDGKLTGDEPIIAWAIEISEGTRATGCLVRGISTDGMDDEVDNFYGYLSPNGEVYVPGYTSFRSLDQAQEEFDKEQAREQARKGNAEL